MVIVQYDEAFRDKMAATGVKEWAGMEVQLYQEICVGRPRRVVGRFQEGKEAGKSWGQEKRSAVCWLFNEGRCSYAAKCKFPHVCEMCGGGHPKTHCAEPKRLRLS